MNGRTVIPLTPQPGGVQAWKILIPANQTNAAEVLSLFGRQGEGVHVRAKSEPRAAGAVGL